MRTTVDLPEPLLQSAKRLAAEQHVTLSVVLQDALRGHLGRKPVQAVAPFRLYTVRGRVVRPEPDLDRSSALLLEDDEAAYGGKR